MYYPDVTKSQVTSSFHGQIGSDQQDLYSNLELYQLLLKTSKTATGFLACRCNSTRVIPYIPTTAVKHVFEKTSMKRGVIWKAALLSGSGIGRLAPPSVQWLSVHVADVLRQMCWGQALLRSSPFCLDRISSRAEGLLTAELRRPLMATAAAHTRTLKARLSGKEKFAHNSSLKHWLKLHLHSSDSSSWWN